MPLLLNIHLGLEDVQVQAQFHEDGQVELSMRRYWKHWLSMSVLHRHAAGGPSPLPAKERVAPRTTRPVNKMSLALTLVSMTAMFLLFALLHRLQPQPVGTIGRLDRAIGAKWAAVNGRIGIREAFVCRPECI